MPVGPNAVKVNWRKTADTFFYHVDAPKGFEVTVDTSKLPLKAVRE